MGLLDRIIDGAVDDTVSTENLLRIALIVSHRLQAQDLSKWIGSELNGFRAIADVPLPSYRGPFTVPVKGTYMGYGRQYNNIGLDPFGVEDWFVDVFFKVAFREPIAELERMAEGDGALAVSWPSSAIGTWNEWEEERKVSGVEDASLFAATRTVPKTVARGSVSAARNRLLEMALDLQKSSPDAGEKDGPTIEDTEVRQTVFHVINNIFGQGTNLAIGNGITLSSAINVGDLNALLTAARQVGLEDPDALGELQEAASSGDRPGRLKAFITKLSNGGFKTAGDVATKVTATALTALIEQYLGAK